jgi:hypothetical protein
MTIVDLDPIDEERLKDAVSDFILDWCKHNVPSANVDTVCVENREGVYNFDLGTHV